MSKSPIRLTSDNFAAEVLNADGPVLVDYGAPWCGYCRRLDPVIDRITAERSNTLKVGKVDIDDSPDLARAADVHGIPLVVLYVNGVPVARTTKAKSLADLEREFNLAAVAGV